MAKGVFTSKQSPSYDDLPEERYHFPRTYLGQVEQLVGDQIVYYAPRRPSAELSSRGGAQSYFATARVLSIVDDPSSPDLFYALVDNYLDFDTLVPWKMAGGTFESSLTRDDGGTNKGQFGRSVRILPEHEFEAILSAGFHDDPWDAPEVDTLPAGVAEEAEEFVRPLVQMTLQKPFRDQAFRRAVRLAYNNTCAVTGIELRNGKGRPEVQAAHIKPVEHNGPDSTRNGLALSGTLHWMFDRGLISVGEDHTILTSGAGLPDKVRGLFNPTGRLLLPNDVAHHPHPKFLQHHRENVFKG